MSDDNETKGRCRREMTAAYRARGFKPNDSDEVIAAAIDRLAADVAEVKESVREITQCLITPAALELACDRHAAICERDAAIRERDESRAEVERLRSLLPPTAHLGVRNGPGEGSWSVFACKVVEERDEARAEVYRVKCSMTETSKDRDTAIRERDGARAEVEKLKNELYDREQELLSLRADTVERYTPPAAPRPAAPASGWLREEEKRCLPEVLDDLRRWGYAKSADVIEALISRAGSPPVVEVPAMGTPDSTTTREKQLALAYRAAMDKAGVPWKEVGRE